MKVKVAQSCPTFCDPIDFTDHEILQAWILEWVAFPFSRDLPNPGTNLDSILKNRDITFPTKVICQSYGFSTSHVWMWELDYKESWALNNWCFWTVVLEKTLESPLDCKEIQPVHPKGNQSWIFIGRTDAEAKIWYFGCLMWRTESLKKTLMLGKIEGSRRRGNRGWDGWRASPTWWMWVWASSGSWWWTGKPGVL